MLSTLDPKLPNPSSGPSILLTGAAGFIGSCMIEYLNAQGFEKIILVDDFGVEAKRKNWENTKYETLVERHQLFEWLEANQPSISIVIHLGARTDTTEFDYSVHELLNVNFTKQLWQYCAIQQLPLIYASSAATYGAGEMGYDDDHALVNQLHPLNPYGVSKQVIDAWILEEVKKGNPQPPFWTGLKFFNVYGPNEYHKGRMASVIWHAYNQIKQNGSVKLFKSHHPAYQDGEQLRDFVYVKDLLQVMGWMMQEMLSNQWTPQKNGLYNLGTGKARTFIDLVKASFSALDLSPNIIFIDMPEDLRTTYQYFTEAKMEKLKSAGYPHPFYSLEDGVNDYVRNYLQKN